MALRLEFPTAPTFNNPDAFGRAAISQSVVIKNDHNDVVMTVADDGAGHVSVSVPGALSVAGDVEVSGVLSLNGSPVGGGDFTGVAVTGAVSGVPTSELANIPLSIKDD